MALSFRRAIRDEARFLSHLFERALSHGLVVGLHTRDADEARLTDDERALAHELTDTRRRTFVAGRIALRIALERLGARPCSVLRDARGTPTPSVEIGHSVSISHKDEIAVALVAKAKSPTTVGVDVEVQRPSRFDISRRILCDDELEVLSQLPEGSRDAFVLCRFSLKEAIYKAIDPFVRRYVAFREVAILDRAEGPVAELRLDPPFASSVEIDQIELDLAEVGHVILSTATARPR